MANDIQSFASNADNLTKSIGSIQGSIKSLTKDLMNYKRIQDEVFNKKMEVKCDLSGVRKEFATFFKEVNQGFQESQKSGKAQQKVINEMTQSCKNFAKAAKDAGKLQKTTSESSSINKESSKSNLGKIFTDKDLLQKVGNSLTNYGGAILTSTFGEKKGSTIAGIGGGALSGAAIGTAIAPGIGTAIGAAIGAITGVIDGMTQQIKAKDEFFKSEVKTLYDSVKQDEVKTLNNGTDVAKKTETNKLNFASIIGNETDAKSFVDNIINYSSKNSFKPDDALKISKKLLVSGYKKEDIIPFLDKFGDASSALGLSSEESTSMAGIFGNMKKTNKISEDDLKALDGYGLKATDALSKFFSVSKDKLATGVITGQEALNALTQHMNNNFVGGKQRYSQTYEGMSENIKEKQDILDSRMGEGYNEERKKGLEKRGEFLDQYSGQQGEAYKLMGQYKADLENKHQQSIDDAIKKAMESEEFKETSDGAIKGRLIAEAKAKAEVEYKNSKDYKTMQENEMSLIQSIQADEAVNDGYMNLGMQMAEQFTKGYGNGINLAKENGMFNINEEKEEKSFVKTWVVNTFNGVFGIGDKSVDAKSKAIGLDRVPYDNYPALLHEGERVLTRVEADQQQSSGVTPVINMYNTVRDDSDIDKIVTALVTQLSKAQGSFGGAY